MSYQDTLDFARLEDQNDPLNVFRDYFHIPRKNQKEVIYFCGNSLGLQPVVTQDYLETEMRIWRDYGVEGHFEGETPWFSYHETTKESLSKLVGGGAHEVVSMNNLTTNLHLMLASFYQPVGKRCKILLEAGAFPSDHYAIESHLKMRGIDPAAHMVCVKPTNGALFDTETLCKQITDLGDTLALVLLPGIQYYTGQFLSMKRIAEAAHSVGAFAGFDLAHAIGNLPMKLHDDQVDFAVWCSYKYLNSGPGGVSGVFVHEKHSTKTDFPKLTGWWGHAPESRFKMDNKFVPAKGVDAWMLSNINILSMASHRAALQLFDEAGIMELRKKSIRLTGYLEFLLQSKDLSNALKIITPRSPEARGCQLSISLAGKGKEIFNGLIAQGVILDWREPDVIRVAPAPLYNTFEDVWRFSQILKSLIKK